MEQQTTIYNVKYYIVLYIYGDGGGVGRKEVIAEGGRVLGKQWRGANTNFIKGAWWVSAEKQG